MKKRPPKFEALSREYATLWDSMEITRLHASIKSTAARIVKSRDRYEAVQAITNVPWHVVGVIHAMETGLRFDRHLHNGDPLTARTKLVPPNRPLGQAPFTFEQSCQDALCMKGYDKLPDWTIERTCWALENYNGWGYRWYHPETLSPYLWSGSNHYTMGKYVSDGRWSKIAVSSQSGSMPLLRAIMELCSDVNPVSIYGATSDPEELSPASNVAAEERDQINKPLALFGAGTGGSLGLGFLADPVGMSSAAVAVKGNAAQLFAGVSLGKLVFPILILAAFMAAAWFMGRKNNV